jgi:hypothetical protein
MEMIGQQYPSLDGKGEGLPDLLNPFSQGDPDAFMRQNWLAARGDHGEEIDAAFNFNSPVFWHDMMVRETHPTLLENFLNRHPAGQEIQNQRDPNPMPVDAGLAKADIRVDGNSR